jgi:mono/diheme cytochrome c family protein
MKLAMKGLVAAVGTLVVLAVGFYVWVEANYEKDYGGVPLPRIVASKDPAVIAQGDYVVHALAHCSACHQPAHTAKKRELNPNRTDLRGGYEFEAGPFGKFFASNLTSDAETGLGGVSDGQIARAIRHGVDRRGRFAAFMALSVGNMADEDLTAVVSYLRSLPPKRNPVPHDQWGFVAKALASKFVPRDEPKLAYVPPGAASVERGKYLAHGPAACYACHSQRDPMSGFAYVGPQLAGNPDPEPDQTNAAYELVAPNLTPDPDTGKLATWSEEQFVTRFRTGRAIKGSIMPWENFAQMTDEDLRSIYRYLQTLPPVKRDVGPSRRKQGWKPDGAG